MTSRRDPWQRLVEVAVFAPVGLFCAARDDLPKFVQQGRQQIENRVKVARWIGELAVTQGRKELERHLAEQRAERLAPSSGAADPVAPEDVTASSEAAPAPAATAKAANGHATANGDAAANGDATASGEAAANRDTTASGDAAVPGGTVPSAASTGAPARSDATSAADLPVDATLVRDADALPIEGYESLAALHVVHRLAGLDAAELESVRTFEQSHRARRTILAKIAQLQGE